MEKTLFSTPELAEWLGVFHTTVRRWIERGRIKGVRVGRNYKIPADEVMRILEDHDIPLPSVMRRYRLRQRSASMGLHSQAGENGSILQKLLIVEEIREPAFLLRKTSILVGNQAFADLVGYSQADLIGLEVLAVVDELPGERLIDFAERQITGRNKGPSDYVTELKTGRNGRKKIRITAGPMSHIQDVFLLVIRGA